ncbi:uncharacterized protein SEPMUDRAFT_148390 [Sphaerulina musiva SO2202]|uniref:Uncharacterized protein n=1 Tax=Sphaerulina musiva (strain SO2202) TaxID=692275 RepID=M3C3B9_SPHMS|nr:uncharacterized protein SEPMUDRAFT_148390 [Sphaerulina musiva SO2202]EMF14781.1 hypothetical protein SEPMUDRAFT_148390 [Sphaerulina musiva SO2202]
MTCAAKIPRSSMVPRLWTFATSIHNLADFQRSERSPTTREPAWVQQHCSQPAEYGLQGRAAVADIFAGRSDAQITYLISHDMFQLICHWLNTGTNTLSSSTSRTRHTMICQVGESYAGPSGGLYSMSTP